jgi:sugar-specific transcriptional regulator TrmB
MNDRSYINSRREIFEKINLHEEEIHELERELKHLRREYIKNNAKFKNREQVFHQGIEKEYYVCRINMLDFSLKMYYSLTDKKTKGWVKNGDISCRYVDEGDLMTLKGLI